MKENGVVGHITPASAAKEALTSHARITNTRRRR
jgi:hypothetical protein